MNLLEAIQGAGENWFRPVSLRNSFFKYRIIDGVIYCHDQPYLAPDIDELTGEWEIVTPEQVLSERKL